jgi:hypothetical protein
VSTKKGRYGNPAKRKPLVGDLERLAKLATGSVFDPRKLGGEIYSFDPGMGESLIDVSNSVHLEEMNVCTVDAVRKGFLNEQVIYMVLYGRINKTQDKVQAGYLFGPDGAAAIITELLAVADRFGAELLGDVTRRLVEMQKNKTVDLHFLKAAIELAIEESNA